VGHLDATTLTVGDCNRMVGALRAKKMAPATIRRTFGVLTSALNLAVRLEQVNRNPALHATLPAVRTAEVDTPTPALIAKFLDATAPEFRVFLYVAAVTGARRGEVLALRWNDFDAEAGTLRFRRRLVESKRGVEALPGTKNGRSRTVHIDAEGVAVLTKHRERVASEHGIPRADDYLFGGPDPWRPSGTSNKYRRLRAAVGAEGVRLHHLRHAAATYLLAAGVPVSSVSRRLGHAQTSTTLNIYGHALPSDDVKSAAFMGRLLGSRTA
jgi:integrase